MCIYKYKLTPSKKSLRLFLLLPLPNDVMILAVSVSKQDYLRSNKRICKKHLQVPELLYGQGPTNYIPGIIRLAIHINCIRKYYFVQTK